jgi:transposase-like protein
VLREEEELGAIATRYNLNPNMLRNWKKEFLEKSARVFDESRRERELAFIERELNAEREELLKTVGQLTLERDWLKKKSVEIDL